LRKTIIAICSDMYDGFINAAKEVFEGNIPVIADRYHVARLYRKPLVSLRKRELKKLRKSLSKEEYLELKPAISLLRKRKELSITDEEKEKLAPLFKLAPKIKESYYLCLKLTAIYNRHSTTDEALSSINDWILEVETSKVTCFKDFIKSLKKYKKEICNYFINRNSSGFVEGFNNKAKVLKRRCYGITNIKHLFQRLVLDFSGYKLFGPTLT
jgi:transposase